VLGILGFVTLPIRITTIYSGLPAHPLFVHVPVILIPVTIVAAIVCMVKTSWFSRYGIALAVVSIAAMSSVFLTMQAGAALRGALHLHGTAAHLISEHAQAAHILAVVYVVFTAVLIITFAAYRISGGMPTGLSILDRVLSPRGMFTGLRLVLVLLSLGAAVLVFRVGDLGAKAVWQGRLHSTQAPAVTTLAPAADVITEPCARSFVRCTGLPHRSCRPTTIHAVFGTNPLEIDVFGRRAPGCLATISQLRGAANRLRRGRSGMIDGWRCRWKTGAESCSRANAVLWATNPGE
jgi:hypothetical protein